MTQVDITITGLLGNEEILAELSRDTRRFIGDFIRTRKNEIVSAITVHTEIQSTSQTMETYEHNMSIDKLSTILIPSIKKEED